MAEFVDRARLRLEAGKGGNGCASIRREKYKPLAGPDGGNGGNGGSVIFAVDPDASTLLTYHHSPNARAEAGKPGIGGNKPGAAGADLVLAVPDGTVIRTPEGEELADLVGAGARYVAARGGRGGLGNAALASKRRKAPGFALLGEPGETREVVLELKSIADVALVGFPSAGKSSLIAAMSQARPKIADYPFTTLIPNLGVVEAGDIRFTIADVPGLIPGASEGKGLGLDFLRHIERSGVICHVLDTATLEPGRDPASDLDAIEQELAAYADALGPGGGAGLPLMERPRVIVLNKIDVPDGRDLAQMVRGDLEARGWPVYAVSAATHEGLRELGFALAGLVAEVRAAAPPPAPARMVLRPTPVDETGFAVTRRTKSSGVFYQVRGAKPERWVAQTDFANDEAVGYLADRLAGLGVEDELIKAGAVAGAEVVIGPDQGGVIFEWEPTLQTGPELLGSRGTDSRLEDRHRPTRGQKRERYHDRMDAKAAAREELWTERRAGKWTDPSRED